MLWALVGFCGVRSAAVQTDAVQTDTLHVWVHAACLQSSCAGDRRTEGGLFFTLPELAALC